MRPTASPILNLAQLFGLACLFLLSTIFNPAHSTSCEAQSVLAAIAAEQAYLEDLRGGNYEAIISRYEGRTRPDISCSTPHETDGQSRMDVNTGPTPTPTPTPAPTPTPTSGPVTPPSADIPVTPESSSVKELEDLLAYYAALAIRCDGAASMGHSCVIHHQMVEIVKGVLSRALARPYDDYRWFIGVFNDSKVTLANLTTPASWLDRLGRGTVETAMQVLDFKFIPFDFAWQMWHTQSFSQSWDNSINHSVFNWGDLGAIPAGMDHFVNDLYPGFARNADLIVGELV